MKFEYKLIKHKVSNWLGGVKSDFSDIDNEYNTLGDKGWELVSIMDTNRYQGQSDFIVAVFKREIN